MSRTRTPSVRTHALRRRLDSLEDRCVPAVGLGSALSVGSATDSSQAVGVAADAAGNSYVTGHFYGTVDFDPTHSHAADADILTSVGDKDIYVAKYAPDATLVWAVRMGGMATTPTGGDEGRAIDVDAAGNVYVTGQFRGTGDYGSFTLTAAGEGKDTWVAKLSPAGTVLWANRWGRPNSGSSDMVIPQGLDLDAAGNVYVISLVATTGPDHGYDVLKFSTTGGLQWAKNIATDQLNCDLAADPARNVFVAGTFRGTVDFDPNQPTKLVSSGSGTAGFVLKLTTAGKFGWVSPFVSQAQLVNGVWTYGSSSAQRITLEGSGNVYVGGYYSNKVDFNPASATTNLPAGGGGFITKLTPSGGLVWARAIERDTTSPTYNTAYVYGLATDTGGNVYATGAFYGTVDFNPGSAVASRTSAGSSDIYVLKLTSAGNFVWVEALGGTGGDYARGIAVDPAGRIHIAGYFSDTVDFNPDPTVAFDLTAPAGKTHSFLLRLIQS